MDTPILAAFVIAGSIALSWPLGAALAAVGDPGVGGRPDLPGERMVRFLRLRGGDWKVYLRDLLLTNGLMFAAVVTLLSLQSVLPFNPDAKGALEPSLVFNTAASFVTNTNLQHYSGEAAMSYFSQVGALMWMQFVSAATGLCALLALARGLAGRRDLGCFFADFLRVTFLFLLPLALLWAVALAASGVPMTFEGAVTATTVEGTSQTIARGPVAAFVAIKQLGTNGGGFFGPNSTHPLENPSMLANALQLVAILVLPMACVWAFGRITGRGRHAAVVFAVMLALLGLKVWAAYTFEAAPTPALRGLPVEHVAYNLEGKELRLGAETGPLWSVLTTATSNGSVGAMHDSLQPLAGLVPLAGMWLNETFGGVGVGLINMFLYVVIAVFLAGLMIGRTPQYLGRRIEPAEMRLAALAFLLHPLLILGGTALFAATAWGQGTIQDPGPHGFTEILYEFSSAAANNGSGFEGLSDNTPPWNISTGLVMLLGRFLPIVLPLAIAGRLAAKKPAPESAGTLRDDSGTFGLLLFSTILLLGALTFFPVALLGPIAEHLLVTGP